MSHCFSPKLALRSFAVAAVLCLVIAAALGRATSAGVGEQATSQLTLETSAGSYAFNVEIAATNAERQRGLMYRTSMDGNHGMLFDMGRTALATFWMRNTFLPLDIIFIGDNGRVVSIAAEAEPKSDKLISSVAPVRFVLELNAKKARLMHLKIGDTVRNALIDAVAGRT